MLGVQEAAAAAAPHILVYFINSTASDPNHPPPPHTHGTADSDTVHGVDKHSCTPDFLQRSLTSGGGDRRHLLAVVVDGLRDK